MARILHVESILGYVLLGRALPVHNSEQAPSRVSKVNPFM